jgi:hypothetical protein
MSDEAPRAVDADAAASSDPRTPLLSWQIDVHLVNNRFMLWDFLKVTLICGAIMWTVVAVMSLIFNGEPLFLPPAFVGLIMGIFVVLLVISSLLLLNRWGFVNTLYEEGVGYASGGREKRINRGLVAVGALALLAGKPGVLGSSLIASSQEDGFYPWTDVQRINVHPGPRVISLRNSWRVLFRVYCTPETYAPALAICERKVTEAAAYRAAYPEVRGTKRGR